MKQRPTRIRITTELGLRQTPPPGSGQYARESEGAHVLLLGVGPEPADLASVLPEGKVVYVMEAPDFKAQMPASWKEAIPDNWRFINPEDLDEFIMASAELVVYRPAVRFFPSFWGPVLGRCRRIVAAKAAAAQERTVLLPEGHGGLLVREIKDTFTQAGFTVLTFDAKQAGTVVPEYLREHKPSLYFSINFKGLDPFGELYHLLDAAGVPVCVWCVDNPFHLISGLRAPFWADAHLAVTDDSFTGALKLHGARRVHHMPLAAWPGLGDGAEAGDQGIAERMAFVGRSEFPGKTKFFSGCSIPRWQMDAAQTFLDQGGRPDFAWWEKRLDIWPLWPGHEVRRIGLGAENASREHRAACLMAALDTGLTVFGDEGWSEHLPPDADLRPPVDYYGALPAIYNQAAWTLNVTSLLLPSGLTQRHFDVWAAGGFLLTDATPGLSIFPKELAFEIAFNHPGDLPELAKRLAPGTALRTDLQAAWRKEIETNHTYAVRIATLLEHLDL